MTLEGRSFTDAELDDIRRRIDRDIYPSLSDEDTLPSLSDEDLAQYFRTHRYLGNGRREVHWSAIMEARRRCNAARRELVRRGILRQAINNEMRTR